jgi:hypothetical protein
MVPKHQPDKNVYHIWRDEHPSTSYMFIPANMVYIYIDSWLKNPSAHPI